MLVPSVVSATKTLTYSTFHKWFSWSVTKLIFSRYIVNSLPFTALLRQKINATDRFLPQQNSCGNLKYWGMSGQVTAWGLSFSLKLDSYPLVYSTKSTTKQSFQCASTNGEESGALVTPPTTPSIWRPFHADTAHHVHPAAIHTGKQHSQPTKGLPVLSLIATDREKSDRNGSLWPFLPHRDTLERWLLPGHACGSPLWWATRWKWLLVCQEVTIILYRHNFLPPSKCCFKMEVELLAAGRILASLSEHYHHSPCFTYIHTQRFVCICSNTYQRVLAFGYSSNQEISVATSADIRVSSHKSLSSPWWLSRATSTQQARPGATRPAQPPRAAGDGSPREKNTCISHVTH